MNTKNYICYLYRPGATDYCCGSVNDRINDIEEFFHTTSQAEFFDFVVGVIVRNLRDVKHWEHGKLKDLSIQIFFDGEPVARDSRFINEALVIADVKFAQEVAEEDQRVAAEKAEEDDHFARLKEENERLTYEALKKKFEKVTT